MMTLYALILHGASPEDEDVRLHEHIISNTPTMMDSEVASSYSALLIFSPYAFETFLFLNWDLHLVVHCIWVCILYYRTNYNKLKICKITLKSRISMGQD